MVYANASNTPLKRLIKMKNRVSYQLMVRLSYGHVINMMCEFQTQFDFVFSGTHSKFKLGERVSVRANTLRGAVWLECQVSYIESHGYYSFYQVSILPEMLVQPDRHKPDEAC